MEQAITIIENEVLEIKENTKLTSKYRSENILTIVPKINLFSSKKEGKSTDNLSKISNQNIRKKFSNFRRSLKKNKKKNEKVPKKCN